MMFEFVNDQFTSRSLTGPSDAHVAPPSVDRAMYDSDCPPAVPGGESLKSYQRAYTVPCPVTATSGSQSSNQPGSGADSMTGVDHAVPFADDATNTSRWSRA